MNGPYPRTRRAGRAGSARRRGLVRLGALILVVIAVIVVISSSGGGSKKTSGSPAQPAATGPPALVARAAAPLRAPISGEALSSQGGGVLVIGGLDASDASTNGVFHLEPQTGKLTPAGTLAGPLHDAAAAAAGGKVLVFGGGSTSDVDTVQQLVPGQSARLVGHLPSGRSDLAAVTVGATSYVLGGYDGKAPVGSVLSTTDGRRFATVTTMPQAVRYPAVAAVGNTIYAFGGELGNGQDTNAIQAVDLNGGSASIVGRLPKPLAHASAVVLANQIYILGGTTRSTATDQLLAFDPASNTASPAGHLPSPVTNAAAASVGDAAYLIGGLGPHTKPLASVYSLRQASP